MDTKTWISKSVASRSYRRNLTKFTIEQKGPQKGSLFFSDRVYRIRGIATEVDGVTKHIVIKQGRGFTQIPVASLEVAVSPVGWGWTEKVAK